MANIDYGYKSRILKTDLCKRINAIDRNTHRDPLTLELVSSPKVEEDYFNLLMEYSYKDIQEARKINNSRYNRSVRLRKKITKMLESGHCLWLTLTFSNSVFDNTNQDTRKQYVKRYLKSVCDTYIANIDYGSNKVYKDRKGNIRKATEREHYHAIVLKDYIDLESWSFGVPFVEHIKVEYSTPKKIGKYISKLTNHAIKESTKRCAIIYSR